MAHHQARRLGARTPPCRARRRRHDQLAVAELARARCCGLLRAGAHARASCKAENDGNIKRTVDIQKKCSTKIAKTSRNMRGTMGCGTMRTANATGRRSSVARDAALSDIAKCNAPDTKERKWMHDSLRSADDATSTAAARIWILGEQRAHVNHSMRIGRQCAVGATALL